MALSLIVVALVVGGPDKAVAAGVVIGAVVLVVSMLTRYPLGVIKVLPFPVHSAGDYLAAVLLVASPFALGFNHSASGLTIFYIGAGAAVLLVSLITNYQYSPKGQLASRAPRSAPASTGPTPAATDDRADADHWLRAAAQARGPLSAAPTAPPVPSYVPAAPPVPSYVPAAPRQAAPTPTAPRLSAPAPAVPQPPAPVAAAPSGSAPDSWRNASWQTRALVDLPREPSSGYNPPVAPQPAAANHHQSDPQPAREEPGHQDTAPSRPLREILAERASRPPAA